MTSKLTLGDIEARWEKALHATRSAVEQHPRTYRQLKAQAAEIVDNPVDIKDYFPSVKELLKRLNILDPCARGSIFDIFNARISPSSIWHVQMLRMECKDLLAHLDAFEKWRREIRHLRMVK